VSTKQTAVRRQSELTASSRAQRAERKQQTVDREQIATTGLVGDSSEP
jgi:hypothetical protein